MKRWITILGCGSSGGVPRVGQGWGDCDPANPRNRRRRCSILIEQESAEGKTVVLVDTSPDLRDQLLDADVRHLDGIVYTHDHADHCHGIDDVRPLVIQSRRRIDAFMDETTSLGLNTRFGYVFKTPEGSDYPPILTERRIEAGTAFEVNGAGGTIPIKPFRLVHGNIDALGLKVGKVAYTPDVNEIPDMALADLADLDIWIIDALRIRPHPSHFHLDQALDWIQRMKPRRAVLTNLHNDLDYARLVERLPPGIDPAHDGMRIDFRV
jgi:phosphoribosyl 1,2-cyclic phosphate phosphodiesterase